MSTVHYTSCPVCNKTHIDPLLTVKDHSVSGENFIIWQCSHCSLRFTQDAPDEVSIEKYYRSTEYISHSNTDKGLLNKVYKKVRAFTLKQKAELIISNTTTRGRILDVGAGIGAFLSVMKNKGWKIAGIEPDEGARNQAKKLFTIDLNNSFSLEQFTENSFDAITLWHVLEHVHQLHPYIESVKKLLTPNGKIFIAVPNYTTLDADIYKSNWAAYDVPRHLYHFTPKAIAVLMKEHDLKICSTKPMWFDSFYISLLSSKYQKGKTKWFSAIINGLLSNLKTVFNKDACSSVVYIISKN